MNLARLKFVTLFVLALCKTRKVTYTTLATAFDNKTCKDSNVKRIRNFMKAANFTMELVSKLIFNLLPKKENLTLIMDRTNWKFGEVNINMLVWGKLHRLLIADREFVGKEWIAFLNDSKIAYHIRIRENFIVFDPKKQALAKAWHYFNNLKMDWITYQEY